MVRSLHVGKPLDKGGIAADQETSSHFEPFSPEVAVGEVHDRPEEICRRRFDVGRLIAARDQPEKRLLCQIGGELHVVCDHEREPDHARLDASIQRVEVP